ncbi:MAG TPA: DUF779 domain-containing protein [Actinomycetota bacterium]|nr:DUF779 domain-containing protein [Actinomycetota bacterium]
MHVDATPEAVRLVRRVRDQGRSNLVMVLSNGCCDATAPYLYDDHVTEPDSLQVGVVDGVVVVAPGWLAKLYPGEDTLTIDVEGGVLDDSFSLETEFDCRFVLRAPDATAR